MVAFLVPLGIQAAVRAAPFAARFAKPALKFGYEGLKKGLGYFRPYQMAPGVRASGNQIIQSGKFAGQKFKDVYPNLFRRGNMPRFNITSTNPANIALQTGATAAPFAYDFLTESAEESVNNQENKKPDPGGPVDTVPDPVKPKDKKDKDDKTTSTDDQIKKGDLDSFINDRIGLFEKYIGDDSRKRTKSAAYNAMVQFGLNLASSKDPNLLKAIAESAKDPMKEFADLGNQLMDRAESIKKAGIESGVAAYDKAQDREVDREAIAADILKEQIKQDAKTLSRGEFITATMESIAGNQTLVDAITSVKYDKDGNLIEGAPSDAALIQKYAEEQYDIYRAVEIPPGSAGDELYESLPSGSRYYDQQTGTYGTKP
jgi:hypothetical protein|tara:strand:+ start:431 stop:1549 length:1119 start_codon:yes stop_codon:yes gene_type:complete